jgi:hypothetical protein
MVTFSAIVLENLAFLLVAMEVLWNVKHLFDLLVLNLGEDSVPKYIAK